MNDLIYILNRGDLLFMRRFMLQVTQGCPFFGLHIFVGMYFAVRLFSAFLNSVHLVLVPHEEWFLDMFDGKPSFLI